MLVSPAVLSPAAGYLMPLIVGALLLALFLSYRSARREQHRKRMDQLQRSHRFFETHRVALGEFLASDASPILKDILVRLSDCITDRDLVVEVARRTVAGKLRQRSTDDKEFLEALSDLKANNPDLCATFTAAGLSGFFAGVLRWPESAKLFEEVSATVLMDPKRDADVVVAATSVRKSRQSAPSSFEHAIA